MNVHSHPIASENSEHKTKTLILAAALRCFAERGYFGTSVPAIAADAGIAAGTLYRHFEGKELLVNVLYRRCKQALIESALQDISLCAEPRVQFRQLWLRLMDYALRHPDAFQFLEYHHHAPYLDAESKKLEADSLQPVAELIRAATSFGAVRDVEPAVLVSIVWGALVRLTRAQREGYFELTEDLIQQSEEACWSAIANTN